MGSITYSGSPLLKLEVQKSPIAYADLPALSFQIHQQLVSQSMWGHRLKGLSWRIDVKTKARHIEQLNQPTAIMEMQLGSNDSSKVRFSVSPQ